MDIDLFTWIAQIVNFLILVWLLRHFLYGRIVGAIDAREDQIASRWHQAEQERDKATHEAQSHAAGREELEQKRNEILARARDDAEKQKQQWFQEAREEIETARGNWQGALHKQQQSFIEDLRRMAATEITGAIRRVLRDLADEDLERQTVQQFTKRLARSDEQTQPLKDFISEVREAVTIHTAFGLSQEQQQDLRQAIRTAADRDMEVKFGTSRSLLAGVELRADGRKLAWSIDDYLDGLEERVRGMLEQRTGGQKAEPEDRTSENG